VKAKLCIFLVILPIFCLPKDVSKWAEEKAKSFIEQRIKGVKIRKIKYIFPNKVSLDITYSSSGFFLSSEGILEFGKESFSLPLFEQRQLLLKLTLQKPLVSIKKAFFKRKKKLSIPDLHIIVKDGYVDIEGFGKFSKASGFFKNKKFSLRGYGLGGRARVTGSGESWEANINNAELALIPYIKVKRGGLVDLVIKKNEDIVVLAKLKNASISHPNFKEKISNIKGDFVWKKGVAKGNFSFSLKDIPGKITNFEYRNNEVRIKGCLRKNIFSGKIKENKIEFDISFDNDLHIPSVFHRGLSGWAMSGKSTIYGMIDKPFITGSITLKKKDSLLDISFKKEDRYLIYLRASSIQYEGFNLSFSCEITGVDDFTITSKDVLIVNGIKIVDEFSGFRTKEGVFSLKLPNCLGFTQGKIDYKEGKFELSLFRKDESFLISGKKEKDKFFTKITAKELFVWQNLVSFSGDLAFSGNTGKFTIDQGTVGTIPIHKISSNFSIKDGVYIENLEGTIYKKTKIYTSGNVKRDTIDLEVLVLKIDTSYFSEGFSSFADFRGRIIGDTKNPSIFGQVYSESPKLKGDVIILPDEIVLKNGRINNTDFEFEYNKKDDFISGNLCFVKEKIENLSCLFLFPPAFSGNIDGTATITGNLKSLDINGTVTGENPIFFDNIRGDRMSFLFSIKEQVFSGSCYVTSGDGSLSLDIKIKEKALETSGMLLDFKIFDLPISGNFCFLGFLDNGSIEGTLSCSNISFAGYFLPNMQEGINYKPKKGLIFYGIPDGIFGEVIIKDDRVIELDLSLEVSKNKLFLLTGYINQEEESCELLVLCNNFSIQKAPFFEGKGVINGSLTISGEIKNPDISGMINIDGEKIKFSIFENLDKISCNLSIDDGAIKLLGFYGTGKKARIVARQISADALLVKTEGGAIGIDVPGFIKGEARGELLVTKDSTSGKIWLSNTRFTYPYERKQKQSFISQFIQGPEIIAGRNVWFYNDFCRVEIVPGGSLRLEKETFKPSGNASSKRGVVEYLGYNFSLYSLRFEFRDGIPYLDGACCLDLGDKKVLLSHQGKLEFPILLSLSCPEEPEKSHDELIGILKKEEPKEIFAGIVGERITKEVGRLLGKLIRGEVEIITLFPERIFSSPREYRYLLVGTEVKFGKHLAKRLYIIYNGLIEDYKEERYKFKHRLGFEYDMTRRTSIRCLWTPRQEKREEEYEIGIKKSISF